MTKFTKNVGKKCSHNTCEKKAFSKGFCRYHYRVNSEGGLVAERKLNQELTKKEEKATRKLEILNKLSQSDLEKMFLTPCKTREELMNFVKFFLGLHLPDVNVSRFTDTNPFDVLWQLYQLTVLERDLGIKELIYCASRGSGKCSKKGTLITTKNGPKTIENVTTKDIVWTGWSWQPVVETFDEGIKDGVSITTLTGTLTGSLKHRIQALDPKSGKIDWVFMKDLTIGQWVYRTNVNQKYDQYLELDYDSFLRNGYCETVNEVKFDKHYFYDLEVAKDHSYTSNGFVSHNTLAVAIAQLLAVIHGKRDVVHVGAIMSQAERCYQYVQGFLLSERVKPIVSPSGSVQSLNILLKDTMSKSVLNIGNRNCSIEILPCTLKAVNGPHVSFVTVDEVDTLSTAEAMRAYKDISGMLDSRDGRKAIRVNISTRKSRYGLMNELMENADKQGKTVFRWTVFEFMSRCPDSRSGVMKQNYFIDQMKFDLKTPEDFVKLPDSHKKEYTEYEMYSGCRTCALAPICLGDAKKQTSRSPMLKTIDEVAQKVLGEGPDWALSQLMNLKPSVEGIVYKEFDERLHIKNWNQMWETLTNSPFPGTCDHDMFIKKCFSSDTEVMTNNGFKLFKDLTSYDSIATLNNDGQLEYQIPKDYISYHYKGKMINIYNEIGGNGHHMDMLVTPNHDVEYLHGRNFRKKQKIDFKKVRADEVQNINDFYVPSTWLKDSEDKPDIESPIPFMTGDQFFAYLGLWLSEGAMSRNGFGKMLSVSQVKDQKSVDKVFDLIDSIKWPNEWHLKRDHRFLQGGSFRSYSEELWNFLKPLHYAVSKSIPRYILETASRRQLEILLHWLCFGDGAYMFDGSKQQPYYSTGSKQLADDVQELCFRLGYKSSLSKRDDRGKYHNKTGTKYLNRYRVCFHWKTSNKPADKSYYINNGQNKSEFNQKIQKNISEVDYDDLVYCVTMPSSRLFVRRNGVITLSGNCHSMGLSAFAGIDWGWSNPSTLVVFFIDKRENIYIVRCDGQTYVSNPTWIHHIKTKWHNRYKISLYFPDTADPGNLQEMAKVGLSASDKAGKSKIETGVQVIRKWLRAPGSASPKIFLNSETCKPLIKEFQSYHYKTAADGNVSDDIDTENDHYCFHPDTLISIRLGVTKIKDLQIGDEVLTHLGNFKKVNKVLVSQSKDMKTLKAIGREDIIVTSNHPIYIDNATRSRDIIDGKKMSGQLVLDNNPRFISVKDIIINKAKIQVAKRFLTHTPKIKEVKDHFIDFASILTPLGWKEKDGFLVSKNGSGICPKKVLVTKEIAFLIGYWVAEGARSGTKAQPNGLLLAGHVREKNVMSILEVACSQLGVKSKPSLVNRSIISNGRVIDVRSVPLYHWFSKLGVSVDKSFPDFAKTMDEENTMYMLSGYLFGDGCFTKGKVRSCSISDNITYTVSEMLIKLGFRPCLRRSYRSLRSKNWKNNKVKVSRDQTKISLNTSDSFIFINNILKNKDLEFIFRDKKVKHIQSMMPSVKQKYSNGAWSIIDKITDSDYFGDVYNLEVQDDNSYVANGIAVHNCDALRYAMEGILGKSQAILSSESMESYDVSTIVDKHGNYFKPPTPEEFARLNNITINPDSDRDKLGKIGRLSELEGDEDEDSFSSNFKWSF